MLSQGELRDATISFDTTHRANSLAQHGFLL